MRKARIISAIAIAIFASALSPVKSASRIHAAVKLFLSPPQPAPFWLTYRRFRRCHKCPLFFEPLKTCGSPLSKDLRGLGCYCSMESKSGILVAACWGDENLGSDFSFGWRSHNK
jgi:hypothetical protein